MFSISDPADGFFNVIALLFPLFFLVAFGFIVLVFILVIVGTFRRRGRITVAQWEQHELSRAQEAHRLGVTYVPNPVPAGLIENRRSGVSNSHRHMGPENPGSPMFPGN